MPRIGWWRWDVPRLSCAGRFHGICVTVVAGGMKVALITTIFGLVVALILQVFYNYILSKIEGLTSEMEDSSITLLDMITKYNLKYKK